MKNKISAKEKKINPKMEKEKHAIKSRASVKKTLTADVAAANKPKK